MRVGARTFSQNWSFTAAGWSAMSPAEMLLSRGFKRARCWACSPPSGPSAPRLRLWASAASFAFLFSSSTLKGQKGDNKGP
eukprot:7581625-Pyramimonas_sp.AAC.1